ncbi:class I SAM-dependent methyltransferase [Mycobacterium decipiens]|uniref:SAM-dependent methyltransferase n=1 Tax=Mycobacterium decipiens TaxID=1430326 RepID=A0A1X2LP35_9MYCO|nr:class I SAM-dependent methyltransferase [Mycobacterium decipiens]OSC36778.1 hypothetical protein B8W66_22385 [Mycobacterium decipiens]
MKRAYVGITRALRTFLGATGLLRLLDRWARRSRTGTWARSLLSIYDFHDLLLLDVPWWTFKSADDVTNFLASRPRARVFEWGSGASTAWLAHRAGEVTSIEDNAAWADMLRAQICGTNVATDNVDVRTVKPDLANSPDAVRSRKRGFEGLDFSKYVAAIDDLEGNFDLIVVDGRAREACFAKALPRLAADGLLVFDNVDRKRYREAISKAQLPVQVKWTRGLTPALPYPTRTALVRLQD